MNIDSIKNGIVLDHIKAGSSMKIYDYLKLCDLSCPVAIIKNVPSAKIGKKDMIKIDAEIVLDLDILGYVDPGITVNIIKDSKVVEKKRLELPEKLTGILKCKNPRCITSTEPSLPAVFKLSDKNTKTYRCIYCESKADVR